MSRWIARTMGTLLVALAALPNSSLAASFPEHGRAVSLSVLQERLKTCNPYGGVCPAILEQMAGLRRVDGFIIDEEAQDIILFGQVVDDGWPALLTENFVYALRSTAHKYAKREGNTIWVTSPGVSIDTTPEVFRDLQKAGNQLNQAKADQQAYQAALDEWTSICQRPAPTRVLGLPWTSAVAKTMLDVDYSLKRLAAGDETVSVPGYKSLMDLRMEAVKKAIADKAPMIASTINRFWFFPKPLEVTVDDTAAIIQSFGIQVLTEEQYLNAKGDEVVGSGKASTLAGHWATMLSDMFPAIAAQRPDFRRVENFGWALAVAKTMEKMQAAERSSLDLTWLLDHYKTAVVEVPRQFNGHFGCGVYNWEKTDGNKRMKGRVTMPTCGGVEMRVELPAEQMIRDYGTEMAQVRQEIIKAKPKEAMLYWDF